MMKTTFNSNFIKYDSQTRTLVCASEWNLSHAVELEKALDQINWPTTGELKINGSLITHMDSAGAWLLNKHLKKQEQKSLIIHLVNFSERQEKLLNIIEKQAVLEKPLPVSPRLTWFARIGKSVMNELVEANSYFAFIGRLTMEAFSIMARPWRWRWNELAGVIITTGLQALPIIALLSFMIGVVLAYQMGMQLRNYGANIFIVDLLGLSVLREFAPLLTAIMVAGRTGSAFTAQLGTMKVNQEIDALNTMGVTPGELLLLPRILGLLVALPLLTMWADIFGVIGGMVMSKNMLGIGAHDFLLRFQQQIPVKSLIIGLGKAPVFALLIASIGCFEGMQVRGSADSVGTQTTRSVVWAIFFIIVADAIFSIIFSRMKL